jgi:uncharacterized protein (TIGR02996 family)
MNVEPTLRRAWRAATQGAAHEAIAALLDAWRVTRHPAVADTLDAVAARFGLRDEEVTLRFVDTRLREPADPRTARTVLRALQTSPTPPMAYDVSRAAWLLTLVADVRLLAPIRALLADPAAPWAEALAPVERHLAALPPPVALTSPAVAILEGLAAGEPAPARAAELDAADEAALLAAVLAAPADDAPRLVYADWLTERGDPRGELILLQCARAATGGAPTAREEELLARSARAWLGPLEPWVVRGGASFVRGFLDGCRLRDAPPDLLLVDARWATVTALELHPRIELPDIARLLAVAAHFPSLRRLRTARPREVEELAPLSATPVGRRLRAVELGLYRFGAALPRVDHFAAWLATGAPPALVRLTFVGDASIVTLARAPTGAVAASLFVGARERRRDQLVEQLRQQLGDGLTIDVDKPEPPR